MLQKTKKKLSKKKISKKLTKPKKLQKLKKTQKSPQNKSSPGQYLRSYSPSLNRPLGSQRSFSPRKTNVDRFFSTKCKDKKDIRVGQQCIDYTSERAVQIMSELLKMKPKSYQSPENIAPPKQSMKNCWLNAFFMCYFISDKGQKFFKSFRNTMITGKDTNQNDVVAEKYKEGLWLLNKLITASLFGKRHKNTEHFVNTTSTNTVLKTLKGVNVTKSERAITSPNLAYNPIAFYDNLFHILKLTEGVDFSLINTYDKFNMIVKEGRSTNKTHLYIIERYDDKMSSSKNSPPNTLQCNKGEMPLQFISNGYVYSLDSAVLRDIERRHFTSYVTIQKQEFGYDGAAAKQLQPMNWKQKINGQGVTKPWTFGKLNNNSFSLQEKFDFKKGYHLLFYYRTSQ